jgi:hypothetical protein
LYGVSNFPFRKYYSRRLCNKSTWINPTVVGEYAANHTTIAKVFKIIAGEIIVLAQSV